MEDLDGYLNYMSLRMNGQEMKVIADTRMMVSLSIHDAQYQVTTFVLIMNYIWVVHAV